MSNCKVKKMVIVRTCQKCPNAAFDDNAIHERWGKLWCEIHDRKALKTKIPEWCTLTTYSIST